MPKVASIVFRGGGKVYQFDAAELQLAAGDRVVVDTARGADFGYVVRPPQELAEGEAPSGLKKVLRLATPADLEKVEAAAPRRRTPSAPAASCPLPRAFR